MIYLLILRIRNPVNVPAFDCNSNLVVVSGWIRLPVLV